MSFYSFFKSILIAYIVGEWYIPERSQFIRSMDIVLPYQKQIRQIVAMYNISWELTSPSVNPKGSPVIPAALGNE